MLEISSWLYKLVMFELVIDMDEFDIDEKPPQMGKRKRRMLVTIQDNLDNNKDSNIRATNIYNELQSYDLRLEELVDSINVNYKPFTSTSRFLS